MCVCCSQNRREKNTKTSGISDLIRHFWKFLEYFCQMTKICRSCISSKCQMMFIACVCLHIICTSSCNKLMHAMYNTNSKHCSNGNNAVSNMSAGNLRLYPRQHHKPFIRPATFCCLTCSCTYKERQKGGGGG